ncbi:putative secreted protein [Pseudonocardia sp. N23]|nr:putative secreted protein [Pseudonocardia sp. N23]
MTNIVRAPGLMDTTLIVVIIVIVVVLIGIGVAAYLVGNRRRSARLREHFGPEYDRTLAETDDPKETERHLAEREKRHRSLELRHLDDRERAEFQDRWLGVQSGFVDDPDRAVERADSFVDEVMAARGYPVADFERQAEDVSVDHPVVVQRYREARAISQRNASDGVDTEELRRAVTSYRSLVEALLDESDDRRNGNGRERGSRTEETTR